jgi:hypothetical protein
VFLEKSRLSWYILVRKEDRTMRKRYQKKLNLTRETVRHLATEHLSEAKAAGQIAAVTWSDPPECDPDCRSQTLSCTL